MKIKIFLLASALAFLVIGCDGNAVFEKTIDGFENNRWEKTRPLSFPVKIENSGTYAFDVFFSHVYGYQFPEVPIVMEIQYPDGHTEKQQVVIPLKDIEGNDAGDCAGDYCDLWYSIQPPRALQAGNYEIRLINNFNGPFLPNILGVGLKVSTQK